LSIEKTRIVILGGSGLLGSACSTYFLSNRKYLTNISTRNSFNKDNYFHLDVKNELTWKNIPACDYIINCIGLIKHVNADKEDLFDINSKFVNKLSQFCQNRNTRLIHISTDSVFSGKKGLYIESDVPDPIDDYGESKLLGESNNFMCIRTSTIGEENRGKLCIVEWLKKQKQGQTVNGYLNQYWNGMTAKEYAKMCDRIISKDLYVNGVRHVYANVITKYELLERLNRKYDLGLSIIPTFLESKIDRTLISEYNTSRKLEIPSIEDMLEEL
jgi:dTDP-4-dehydrorhamnose reductase